MSVVKDVKLVGTIGRLEKKLLREGFILVTDSQDVRCVKDSLGNSPYLDDFDGFFIRCEAGEIAEVYGFEGNVPYNWKDLYRIEIF